MTVAPLFEFWAYAEWRMARLGGGGVAMPSRCLRELALAHGCEGRGRQPPAWRTSITVRVGRASHPTFRTHGRASPPLWKSSGACASFAVQRCASVAGTPLPGQTPPGDARGRCAPVRGRLPERAAHSVVAAGARARQQHLRAGLRRGACGVTAGALRARARDACGNGISVPPCPTTDSSIVSVCRNSGSKRHVRACRPDTSVDRSDGRRCLLRAH